MSPKTITLTHANNGQQMELATALIAGWYHAPGNKCTFIVASGGAIFPASESVDEVKQLYYGAPAPNQMAMTPAAKAEISKE